VGKNDKTPVKTPAYKAGDIVYLRSGSDPMTVEVVLPYHKIHPAIGYICIWMYEGNLRREEISEAALEGEGEGKE